MWAVIVSTLRLLLGLTAFGMMVVFITITFSLATVIVIVIAKEIIRDGILDKGEWFKKEKNDGRISDDN